MAGTYIRRDLEAAMGCRPALGVGRGTGCQDVLRKVETKD